jgi:hypothetical protein
LWTVLRDIWCRDGGHAIKQASFTVKSWHVDGRFLKEILVVGPETYFVLDVVGIGR